jgi:TetR/AcrR family transcriptional regulator, transcriptional repressor for nem operon
MRYEADHKERTRAKVIAEAAKAIRADGPHRLGVAAVMAKAGLTHGGFYAHFASRDDLVAEAIAQMFVEVAGRFEAAVSDKPPAEALRAYIDFYLSRAHRDERERGCPLPTLSADLPRLPLPARERYTLGVRNLTERLSRRLAVLGHAEPDHLAASALAELIGALVLARAVSDPELSDTILANSKRALKHRLGVEKAA